MTSSTFSNIVFVSSLLFLTVVSAQERCPDVSPCTCRYDTDTSGYFLQCVGVPMEEVKALFSRIAPFDIKQLYLYIQHSGDFVPADLLGQSRVKSLLILDGVKIDNSPVPLLTVDPNAFRSSKDTLESFRMSHLNTTKVDFVFFNGIPKIKEIDFFKITDIEKSFHTLPPMPSLSKLTFYSMNGLKDVLKPGNLFLQGGGLNDLLIYNCDFDEIDVDVVLNWALPSSSQTLRSIDIAFNRIEFIPRQVKAFPNLETLNVKQNNANLSLPKDSIYMIPRLNTGAVQIEDSPIVYLESGAFQGNYSGTAVRLVGNNLTRFDEGVFKSMLQDFYITGDRNNVYLDVSSNPFDCYSENCYLAWLLRDNRYLLDYISNASCVDGTAFAALSPSVFDDCP